MPVTSTMSPASASASGTRSRPEKPRTWLTFASAERLVPEHHGDLLAGNETAAPHLADADAPDVARVVERVELELERAVDVDVLRRGDPLEDGLEQRAKIAALRLRIERCPPLQRRRVHHREVELVFVRTELVEELEGPVDDPVGAHARPVHLVHDDDRPQAERERFAGDEPGLRHRPFDRVDEQQHAVDHAEHALDLTAEVRVPGCVHDVDVHAGVVDRAVLGEDRDAALALEVVRIHHPLGRAFVGGEGSGLLQQAVDERRLAVVDVGDDGDVADEAGHGLAMGVWQCLTMDAALQ